MNDQTRRRGPTLAAAAACAALVLAPGAWAGDFSGTRFVALHAAALMAIGVAALACLVVRVRPMPWRTAGLLTLLIAVKVALGLIDVPAGWRGTYTMLTPEPPVVADFAWRLGSHAYRVDPDLVLRDDGFRWSFLNDYLRYNGPQDAPPRTVSKAVRVYWTGWFDSPGEAELELHAQVRGRLQIFVDRDLRWTLPDGAPLDGAAMSLAAGRHRIDVAYDKPANTAPAVFVRPLLDGRPLTVQPWPGEVRVHRRLLAIASDAVVLLGLLVWLWQMLTRVLDAPVRGNDAMGGAVAALAAAVILAVFAVWTSTPFADATYEFRPGDDHLAYEGLARNILSEGILMPQGRAIGQGRPFFFYPLYSYVLAGMHLAFGDTHASIVLLNAAAAVALPVALWLLGWRRLGVGAQLLGQGLLLALVLRHNARYFESPLTDSLFIPIVFLTLAAAVAAMTSGRPSLAFLTGIGIAAGATTRPSFFLFLAPYLLVTLWYGWRRPLPVRFALPLLVVIGYALALAPVVLRNWLMSGQAVAMVTLSHSIPIALIPPEAQGQFVMPSDVDLLQWSSSLGLAWDIIRADPLGVAWLELRKVLFTLGLTNLGPGGPPLIVEFPVLCLAGTIAMTRRRLPMATMLVLLAFLVSHLAASVIAYPWTYGYKIILPVHIVFLFSAVHLLAAGRADADDVV